MPGTVTKARSVAQILNALHSTTAALNPQERLKWIVVEHPKCVVEHVAAVRH